MSFLQNLTGGRRRRGRRGSKRQSGGLPPGVDGAEGVKREQDGGRRRRSRRGRKSRSKSRRSRQSRRH